MARVTMSAILDEVAAKHRVPPAAIRGPRRYHQFVLARQEAMYRCREEAGKSFPQIAAFLGRKDHTTVLYGVRRHRERLEREG